MIGASCAPAEQRLDDCRADRHDEHRFDEKAEPGELHELATGGRALHLTLRIQRRVPLLAIELAHQPAGRKAQMQWSTQVFGGRLAWQVTLSEKCVRLAQKMQVGPCIPVGIQP